MVTSHIPEPTPNFACNSPTTLSNHEFTTLELQRFQTLLKLYPIELCASFLGGGRMGAAGGVAGSRKPGVRLSGNGVAFARLCPCGVETLVAFARVGRASTETVIAFAGEKWVFLACFSVAEVLSVSVVVVEG